MWFRESATVRGVHGEVRCLEGGRGGRRCLEAPRDLLFVKSSGCDRWVRNTKNELTATLLIHETCWRMRE